MSHNFNLVPNRMTSKKASKEARFMPPHKVLSSWESESCFQNQQDIFSAMIFDIDKAEHQVYMEMFIFALDGLGMEVLDALKRAAKRGVDVRLLVDGLGSLGFTPSVVKQLEEEGLKIKVFKPLNRFCGELKTSFFSSNGKVF